jgi:hypothetical protein
MIIIIAKDPVTNGTEKYKKLDHRNSFDRVLGMNEKSATDEQGDEEDRVRSFCSLQLVCVR